MKKLNTIGVFVLIAILVMLIGGLAGWYVVLRMKGQTISFQDAARGFGFGAPSANQNGSTFENLGIGGGGFAVGGGGGGSGAGGIGGGGGAGGPGGANGGAASNAQDLNGDGIISPQEAALAGTSTPITTGGGASSTPSTVVVPKTPRLWRVTKTPIAGFEFATSTATLHFAERATGYMFRADAISGEVLRRTNTLMPKTYEAFITRSGGAIYRSINETTSAVQTFTGAVGSSSSANVGTFVGTNLKNNILAFDANPDTKIMFYLLNDGTKTVGITAPWTEGKSAKEKQVFSSLIASWQPYALSDGRLIIVEKPQDGALGYAYEINADGSFKPLVRAAPGLTFLPLANSSAFVFGTSDNGRLALYAKASSTTSLLSIKTVADKCIWAPYTPANGRRPASDLIVYCAVPSEVSSRNFLQDWYMGALHTSDSWWRINLTNGKADQIFKAESGVTIDVVDPGIDPTGAFLAFKNGNDGTLWVLRIVK